MPDKVQEKKRLDCPVMSIIRLSSKDWKTSWNLFSPEVCCIDLIVRQSASSLPFNIFSFQAYSVYNQHLEDYTPHFSGFVWGIFFLWLVVERLLDGDEVSGSTVLKFHQPRKMNSNNTGPSMHKWNKIQCNTQRHTE